MRAARRVRVTQKHINAANAAVKQPDALRGAVCPVAQATGWITSRWYTGPLGESWRLGPRTVERIAAWDRGEGMEPFTAYMSQEAFP